ncbi:MAG: hypothetical protein COA84_07695 [Robiginitomaculum sp.]|nr:MAG: hypothetical protein COA84_07695 [Robiginitomaculum sp.]
MEAEKPCKDNISALAEWMKMSGKSNAWLAYMLDVSVSSIYSYMLRPGSDRHQIPYARTLLKIYILTGGRITPNDFYNLPTGDALIAATYKLGEAA